jgi:uncharacterized protein (DUF58 family)
MARHRRETPPSTAPPQAQPPQAQPPQAQPPQAQPPQAQPPHPRAPGLRPTTRGAGTAAGGLVLLATGFVLAYPELAVLGATALIACCCALGYAALRPALLVRREVEPDRVTRGEASTQRLTVGNGSRLRQVTLIAQDTCGDRSVPVPLIRLRRGRDTEASYPVPTHRRGVVRMGPLILRRRDPLGLVETAGSHGGTATVWVYPRTHPLTAVPAGIARSLDGRIDRVPHGSITFDTLREYVIGDELRHVHWRTTARIGELMVREHLDTSVPRIVLLLDDRAGGYPDPECFEHACEAAASVLVAAVREDLPADLLTVTATGAPRPRPGSRTAAGPLLDRLAEAELAPEPAPEPVPGAAGSLARSVRMLRQYRLGDTLVFLTGTGAVADLALLGALRPGYPTLVAGVFGDPALVPPAVAGMHLLAVPDAAAFAAAWDGTGAW